MNSTFRIIVCLKIPCYFNFVIVLSLLHLDNVRFSELTDSSGWVAQLVTALSSRPRLWVQSPIELIQETINECINKGTTN